MNLKYLALAIFLREAHKLKVWKRGYTLIEVLVVLAIMSVFSVLAIFGLGNARGSQTVIDAQKNIISDLRYLQGQVINGADNGVQKDFVIISSTQYTLAGNVKTLPNSVTFSNGYPSNVCFFNPKSTSQTCRVCASSYACDNLNVSYNSGSYTISVTNGSTTRSIIVYGTGVIINRIDGT